MGENIERLVEDWCAMELGGDGDALDGLLADDFVGIGPLGYVLAKEQWLARYTSGDFAYQSLSWDNVQIRRYGDTALVTGVQVQKAAYLGRENNGSFRGSQVYVRIDGRWRLAGVQLSMMPSGS